MSFDITLMNPDDGEPLWVERHTEGGTIVLGGTREAELNVTYNHSAFYYEHLNSDRGLRWLDGKRGAETIEALDRAVTALGTERDADYWRPTPGNAGHALSVLLRWARQHPDGIWRVS